MGERSKSTFNTSNKRPAEPAIPTREHGTVVPERADLALLAVAKRVWITRRWHFHKDVSNTPSRCAQPLCGAPAIAT